MRSPRTRFISFAIALFVPLAVALGFAAPGHAAQAAVGISNQQFTPKSITVTAGDTVVWTNDSSSHTVTASDGSRHHPPNTNAPTSTTAAAPADQASTAPSAADTGSSSADSSASQAPDASLGSALTAHHARRSGTGPRVPLGVAVLMAPLGAIVGLLAGRVLSLDGGKARTA